MFLSPVVNRFLLEVHFAHRLSILSAYLLSPVLRSCFAGLLRHKHLTHWVHPVLVPYVGVLEMV
jgi:hypothetical protein